MKKTLVSYWAVQSEQYSEELTHVIDHSYVSYDHLQEYYPYPKVGDIFKVIILYEKFFSVFGSSYRETILSIQRVARVKSWKNELPTV